MVSRENAVIALCVLCALPVGWAVESLTASFELSMLALFLVGIGLPSAANWWLDRRADAAD